MSDRIVDADKLPLSLAAALSATEPPRYFCDTAPRTMNYQMTFVSYHFHFFTRESILLYCSGRERRLKHFYDMINWFVRIVNWFL